jgi:hypothetical protein
LAETGLFGTTIGILDSFRGFIGSHATWIAMTANSIAEAWSAPLREFLWPSQRCGVSIGGATSCPSWMREWKSLHWSWRSTWRNLECGGLTPLSTRGHRVNSISEAQHDV